MQVWAFQRESMSENESLIEACLSVRTEGQGKTMLFLRFVDENLDKILPEVDIDWSPVFTILYMSLPQDLTIWEERDSRLLDPET